jgi:hypothetical protein
VSTYFNEYQTNTKDFCYLGYGDYDYINYGYRREYTPEVCRLGLAIAYLSIMLSLLMLCEESLRKGRDTPSVLGYNSTTARIFLSIAMGLLWMASCIYCIWGLTILSGYLRDIDSSEISKNDIKTAGAFYIIFQAFSAVAWVRFVYTCGLCFNSFSTLVS